MHDARVEVGGAAIVGSALGSARRSTPERAVLLGSVAATLICELVLLSRMNLAEIVRQVPDDSFFYLIIGERLRDSGKFSFDGEHLTYGFQPLYQWVVAALAFVIRDPIALLYSALILGSVLHVSCAWFLFRLVQRMFGNFGAWTAFLFWLANPALIAWFWSVKENGLYTLLLLWVFAELLRAMESDGRAFSTRRLGLALGLSTLARVNFLLIWAALAFLVILGVGWRATARQRVRQLASSAGWACLVAAPWFIFAALHFGSAFPTSGTIKIAASKDYVAHTLGVEWLSPGHFAQAAHIAYDYLDQTFKGGCSGYGPLVQGALIAVLAGWAWTRLRPNVAVPGIGRRALSLLAAIGVCALVNAFSNALLLPQFLAYGQWYTAPEFVALGVSVGWIGMMAHRHLASAMGAALLALGLALGVLVWTEVRRVPWLWHAPTLNVLEQRPHSSTILLEIGLWIRDHVPDGERIGVYDPGIVTFFSGRHLVPLDPLVNSREFFLEERRDILDYVRRNRISYVFGAGVRSAGQYRSLLLPPESYEVVWVPYPDVDLGWRESEPCYWMVVRPLDTPGPAFLRTDDFTFGSHASDSSIAGALLPARAQGVGRALEGFRVECDVLRLHVAPRAGARMWIEGELFRDTAAGPDGWIDWDVSGQRGRHARVEPAEGGAIDDAHFVDLRFDTSGDG